MLELTPSPLLEGIVGDTVTFMCGPLGSQSVVALLVNGVDDTSVAFDDATGNRTYTLGPLEAIMDGTTYQCTSGALSSETTTLRVYCELNKNSSIFSGKTCMGVFVTIVWHTLYPVVAIHAIYMP